MFVKQCDATSYLSNTAEFNMPLSVSTKSRYSLLTLLISHSKPVHIGTIESIGVPTSFQDNHKDYVLL